MKVRHIRLHPDEFLAAVAGDVTPEDLGVYWMICLLIYSRGEPIREDYDWLRNLFRGVNARGLRSSVERLIARGHVKRLPPGAGETLPKLSVNRCETELELARNRIETSAKHGRNGGRPRSKTKGLGKGSVFSDEKLTTNQEPVTRNQEKDILTDVPKEAGKPHRWSAEQTVPMEWIAETYQRYPLRDGYAEAEKFATYWTSGKGAKVAYTDWHRTWLNWMGKAREGRDTTWTERYGWNKHLYPSQTRADREAEEATEWRRRLALWRESGVWHDHYGAPPGKPSCLVPPEFLIEEAA